ncbi:hypothetical protein GGR51DRAFT_84983 [Nemania sp. FL0031]|nr:hypothetical protein GGR51DRAFT_84983 [Nemania sp. FL0031]
MASTDDPALYHHLHDAPMPPSLSPRSSLPMTPPELDHHRRALSGSTGDVAADLDRLVHRLNRKPIFQDSLRWHFLDQEAGQKETGETDGRRAFRHEGLAAFSAHISEQWEPSELGLIPDALGSIPEVSMSSDPHPSSTRSPPPPPLYELPRPPVPSHSHTPVPDAPSEEKHTFKPNDLRRPRRSTDTRLHKSASNLRMLDLVTGMIENGVQCNVQTSTPPSPSKTPSTSSAFPTSMGYIEPQDPINPNLVPGRMQLEIDVSYGELDAETILNDNLALRHASAPAGIKKFGLLRYRSSSEAAQSCKNMKKSVPRMRRRRKASSPSRTCESTASRPPSTVS